MLLIRCICEPEHQPSSALGNYGAFDIRRALANKLTKASFFIMRDQVPFDAKRLFNG